jgi:Anthrone oxygenase
MSIWKIADASLLLLCASMYLGTGWSLVLFSFPSRSQLTVANYYEQFVPPVDRATRFFTWMTVVMIASAGVLIGADRDGAYVVPPSVTLAGVLAATGLTLAFIIPYNKRMAAGITDEAELQAVLGRWMRLNWVRVSLWTLQWLAIMSWFAWRLH